MAGARRQSFLENMKEGGLQASSLHHGVKPTGMKKEDQSQSHSFWKEAVTEKGGVAFFLSP